MATISALRSKMDTEARNNPSAPWTINEAICELLQAAGSGGLRIPFHDHQTFNYTGSDLTSIVYRIGGASGTIVGTKSFTYSAGVTQTIAITYP